MIDGPTQIADLDLTEANREFVRSFAEEVLVNKQLDRLARCVNDADGFVEHHPHRPDGLGPLSSALSERTATGDCSMGYERVHRVLAEGNFVLCAREGSFEGADTAFYDLFRVASNHIVEHWGSIEAIPPRSERKNDDGKF